MTTKIRNVPFQDKRSILDFHYQSKNFSLTEDLLTANHKCLILRGKSRKSLILMKICTYARWIYNIQLKKRIIFSILLKFFAIFLSVIL